MGIPKFFAYITERYPLTLQLIKENKIPEFDNLYLDFNGIIHNCSHPNDEDGFLSEEQIFASIFTFVDHLFRKIKPKLLFMAVDGVAPRAKMNQQRTRRFRSAKNAKEKRERAEANGEILSEQEAFDSNCITPGTPFMIRLSAQLRYFINKKITEDSNWRDVEVVLSGHDVPGEGEHKIMEYIRLSRAQPGYNPNVRHCLYGLDADLIMLGLVTHEPHFCLLREYMKFGPARKKKSGQSLEQLDFYLVHLSLMREYLDLEFREIDPRLPFVYDLERIIDDFVLLAVFVGNDFLPNLPDVHIHLDGLEKLFEVYKKALPMMEGYINENGVINTANLQTVLNEMAHWERYIFKKDYADIDWFERSQRKPVEELARGRNKAPIVMTEAQRAIFDKVKAFVLENRNAPSASYRRAALLAMPNDFSPCDRRFIDRLSTDLHLSVRWDEYDKDMNLVTWRLPALHDNKIEQVNEGSDEWDSDEAEDGVGNGSIERTLRKYANAPVENLGAQGAFDERYQRQTKEKMDEWKRVYYQEKFGFSTDDSKAMGNLANRYLEGLQWVMHYYYSGIASWGWFYDYHYAPRISDLKDVDKMTFRFDLGKPFRPYEQLMGVLPAASMNLIPVAYQDLMYDPNSPILDFYPSQFEQDLNGKRYDWEAILKLPFIDEAKLLKAMATREHRLTPQEKQENSTGRSTKFKYSTGPPTTYQSPSNFLLSLDRCACVMEPFDLSVLTGIRLVQGFCDGVALGASSHAGFPSLETLPYKAILDYHGVNIHGQESRKRSLIIDISDSSKYTKAEDLAKQMIGERIFFNWPFLQEGLVVAVSDSLLKYEKLPATPNASARVISTSHGERWQMKAERIERHYSTRYGVILGNIELLLRIRPLKGLKQSESGAFIKDYAEGPNNEIEQAVQMCLTTGISEDPRYQEREASSLAEEFPDRSTIFSLEERAYGTVAKVSSTTKSTLLAELDVYSSDNSENNDFRAIVKGRKSSDYYSFYNAANLAGITTLALAKIASSFLVITSDGAKSNLGLSLKFDAKGLKVIGYSQKSESGKWDYSQKTIDLVKEYKTKFPEVFHVLDYKSNGMIPASEIFTVPEMDADTKVREIRKWLQTKGVLDFEPVPLICDKLIKETIAEIESLADKIVKKKSSVGPKEIIITDIHRQAVLKPSQAIYRLQDQRFALGDRVIMVQDSGSVPLAVKGVVVGLYEESIDVVWDVPIMLGGTLGGCCSQYRGSTVEFNTCLNLSDPQFIYSTKPKTSPHPRNEVPLFRPQYGAHTAIQTVVGQAPVARLRSATQPNPSAYAPNSPNGRGEPLRPGQSFQWPNSPHAASTQSGGAYVPPHLRGGRGGAQGGFVPERSGRGGFQFNGDRGRGSLMSWRDRDFGERTTGRGSYLR